MEQHDTASIFESLNLNPQLFINETLNTVDDMLLEAFEFFHQEASTLVNAEATGRSHQLEKGIEWIHNVMQLELDTQLSMWEKYCLHHCFAVPKGLSLPENKELPQENLMSLDMVSEPNLDAQLDSLRDRLTEAGKESAALNHELQALERQLNANDGFAAAAADALQLYEQNNTHGLFQEMMTTMSELRKKMEKLRSRTKEDAECIRTKRIYDPSRDDLQLSQSKGLLNARLEDLEGFIENLKKI